MDIRRERQLIDRHQAVYQRLMGTTVRWAVFDAAASTEDPLFSDGGGVAGRSYLPLITVPVMWMDNIEGRVNQDAFRTDKSDNVRAGFSYSQMRDAGIPNMTDDDAHDLDIFYWPVKDQWYRVDEWEVLGNYGGISVVIGVTGVQIYPDEEYVTEASPPIGAPPVS